MLIALVYAALLAVLSLLPSAPEMEDGPKWDTWVAPSVQNFLHLPAYAVLAGLAIARVGRSSVNQPRVAFAAIVLCVLYGALLEGLQEFIPGRFASLSDVGWNTAGVVCGTFAWFAVARLHRRVPAASGGSHKTRKHQ